jgi:hypothetical protein
LSKPKSKPSKKHADCDPLAEIEKGTTYILDASNAIHYTIRNEPTLTTAKAEEVMKMFQLVVRFGIKDPQETIKTQLHDGKDRSEAKIRKYTQLRLKVKMHLLHVVCQAQDMDEMSDVDSDCDDGDVRTQQLLDKIASVFGNSKQAKKRKEALMQHVEENPPTTNHEDLKMTHIAFVRIRTTIKRLLKEEPTRFTFHGAAGDVDPISFTVGIMIQISKAIDASAPQEEAC